MKFFDPSDYTPERKEADNEQLRKIRNLLESGICPCCRGKLIEMTFQTTDGKACMACSPGDKIPTLNR